MTDLSKANTSGLEVVAWRWRFRTDGVWNYQEAQQRIPDVTCEPLVTAASAQARIAELEAEVKKLRTIMKGREELATGLSLNMNALAHDVASDMADRATAAEARADRLAKALEAARGTLDAIDCQLTTDRTVAGAAKNAVKRIDAALQQETQP